MRDLQHARDAVERVAARAPCRSPGAARRPLADRRRGRGRAAAALALVAPLPVLRIGEPQLLAGPQRIARASMSLRLASVCTSMLWRWAMATASRRGARRARRADVARAARTCRGCRRAPRPQAPSAAAPSPPRARAARCRPPAVVVVPQAVQLAQRLRRGAEPLRRCRRRCRPCARCSAPRAGAGRGVSSSRFCSEAVGGIDRHQQACADRSGRWPSDGTRD